MIYLRGATLLDILSVYDGVCQDERDEIAATGHSIDPSDVARTIWGAVVRYTIADSETSQPLAVLGCYRNTMHGVYQVYMLCRTDAWERCGKDLSLLTGHTLAETFKALGATRFELLCLSRRLLAQRWYVKLGFVKECEMAGTPFTMYVYTGEKT